MNRAIRRVLTTTGATVGALALFTGTAAAHYCYFDAPERSQGVNGKAWHSPEEFRSMIEGFTATWEDECATARDEFLAQLDDMSPTTRIMGPGLLAGGAVHQDKAPKRIAHLSFDMIPEECFGD
jgi:hypothetical protein